MNIPWWTRVGLAFVLISDTPLFSSPLLSEPVHRDSKGEKTRGTRTCSPASAAFD